MVECHRIVVLRGLFFPGTTHSGRYVAGPDYDQALHEVSTKGGIKL